MQSCTSRLCDFEFDPAAIARAAAANRLLTLEIEFSLRCKFRCPYCYVPAERYFDGELSPDEIRNVLVQARDQGIAPYFETITPQANARENKWLEVGPHTKGPCQSCEPAEGCYGCHGAAFQMTGDYLASDPMCWRNCQCAP